MKEKISFEISPQIGGFVQSLKKCRQELITDGYKGNRDLSLDVCKSINTITSRVRISRSGSIEPVGAKDAPDGNYHKGADLYG